MIELLFTRRDTARILAFQHVRERLRQRQRFLFDEQPVLDHVDCRTRIDIAYHVEIDRDIRVDLDDIFLAHFAAGDVLDNRDGNVECVEPEQIVQLHGAPGFDMVDHDAVLNGINVHKAASFKSLRISAMRIYLPLSTCLK